MDLSLQAVAFADAGIGLGAVVPLTPGAAALSAGAVAAGTADRKMTFSFDADFTDPKTMKCDRDNNIASTQNRLRGNLGIETWLINLQKTINDTQFKPDKIGYSIEFTLVRDAKGGVEFSAIPAGTSLLGGSLNLNGKRTDVHTLTIAFLEKSPPPPPKKRGVRPKARVTADDRRQLQLDLQNLIQRNDNETR